MAFPTLLELAAANGSDADKLIASEIIQRSDLLNIMQWRSIAGASTTAQLITSRPTVNTRGFNQGVTPAVVGRSSRVWKTALFEEHSNVDVFLANDNPATAGGPQGFRADEDMEFLRAMGLKWESLAINGNQETTLTDFDGMEKFLNASTQSNVTLSTGGSGNRTSILFFSIGNRSILGLYNENSSAFPKMDDKGEVSYVQDANGDPLSAFQTVFTWQAGLRIDEAGIGRVANVQPGATNLLDDMEEIGIQMKIPPTAIITSRAGLQEIQKVKTGVLQSQVESLELKRMVTTWNGLPILVTDSISSAEAAVS